MHLALFGWNSSDWEATIGIVGVFFVFFPILVNALLVYIGAQILGERAENERLSRGGTSGSSPG